MSKIIVMEGPDKVGKETQSKLLHQALTKSGYKAIRVEVPTRACPKTYWLIYKMLTNGWARKYPNAFQFVQFLNKWLFQLKVLPALEDICDVIIFDRWSLSAIIYGAATGVNAFFNVLLCRALKKADLTFVFHGKSYRRNTVDDSYESDSELQANVRRAYCEWAVTHPEDSVLVSNDKKIDDVHANVLSDVRARCML